MKVIANVEKLAEAMQAAFTVGHTVTAERIYDALPDAPLPADVASAVDAVAECNRLNGTLIPNGHTVTTILRALTASVASEQRLREALNELPLGALESQQGPYVMVSLQDLIVVRNAALAATPATGLTVRPPMDAELSEVQA